MGRTSLASLIALGIAFAVGCSSSDPGSEPAPGPASTAPAPAPSDTTTPPGTPVTPPGPPLTIVRVHYASNRSGALTLRGSSGPLSWNHGIAISSAAPGLYQWSTPDLKTDLELKPVLGDTWSRGPNYKVKAGHAIDIYPHFFETAGIVTKQFPSFVSVKLPSTRDLWVYVPPTYVENSESRFGVLYMHDGQNLFSPDTAFGGNEWKVDETLDTGAEDGSIRETIVVGVGGTAARIDELTPTNDPSYGGGKADQYLAMIVDEIKPMIDQKLRTWPRREVTAVMGSSLGGLVSAYAGVHRADVFGLVGEMSPSTWWDGTMIIGEVGTLPTRPARPLRVYVDSGDSGNSNDDVTNTTALAAKYRSVGYSDQKDLLHVVAAGAQHNETYWAQRLPAALHFLLGARPD